MYNGEYLGSGSAITKLLCHMEGNSNDSSGNSVAWTDANMAYGLAYGRFGQGAHFNSTPNSRISAATPIFAPLSAFTLLAWFRTANATASGRTIYGEGNSAGGGYNQLSLTPAHKLAWSNHDDASGTTQLLSANTYNDGLWHNVCIIKVASNSRILIIDGNKEYITNSVNIGTTTLNQKSIGSINNGGITGYWNNGDIDEVIGENVAWTQQQYQKYYTYAIGRFGTN